MTPARTDHDVLEIIGKVLALSAALLPPTGFVVRATALSLAFGPSIGVPLAWSAPFPQLAADGFFVVAPTYISAIVIFLISRRVLPPGTRAAAPRRSRRFTLLAMGLMVAPLAVFYPGFPGVLVGVPTVVAVMQTITRAFSGGSRFRLREVWWLISVGLLLVAIFFGTGGAIFNLPPAEISFANGSPLRDGRYLQVGEAEGLVYLQPCGSADVRVVPTSEIKAIAFIPPPLSALFAASPSLWDIVANRRAMHLGLQLC